MKYITPFYCWFWSCICLLVILSSRVAVTHFWPMFPFYTLPLKTPENQRFSVVFRGYKMGTFAKNGLTSKLQHSFRRKSKMNVTFWKSMSNLSVGKKEPVTFWLKNHHIFFPDVLSSQHWKRRWICRPSKFDSSSSFKTQNRNSGSRVCLNTCGLGTSK